MIFLRAIQQRLSVVVLALLLFVIIAVLRYVPDASDWANSPAFRLMPYMMLILCFVLGACFHQSRISFLSLFMAALMMLISHAAFVMPDDRRLYAVVLLASIYFPVLVVVFYHMKEQGILSAQGYLKIAIVLSALAVLLLVPKIPSLTELFSREGGVMLRPLAGWLPLPLLGVIALLFSVPLLMIARAHESPSTGPLLAVGMIYAFMGLSLRGNLWPPASAQSAFVLLNTGACVVMIWIVLESAWRHANIDELTQLPGRRALKLRMDRLSRRYGLAMVDIDHFKKINDKYGHDTGDQVLRYIASQLRKSGVGHVYRYGGEEFVIVSSTRDVKEFAAEVDDMRDSIAGRPFGVRGLNRPKKKTKNGKTDRGRGGSERIKVTVSAGVAVCGTKYDSPPLVLQAADKALYRAKRAGRNKVRIAK